MKLRWKVVLLFCGVFAPYFFTRSPALDEWDSVQFAMGVTHFDLWHHQPHPPGYPLYIFCGWLGARLLHWDPAFSLQVASCAGGALLVVAWFLITRLQFNERLAWLVSFSLAVTPIVWMTAVKVLTDSLASGLLAFELYLSLLYRERRRRGILVAAIISGVLSVGVRPQLILVALVIISIPLNRQSLRAWLAILFALVLGCLTWFIPMWFLQAQLRPDLPWWVVYPKQVFKQWSWRFDKPNVFIGAHGFGIADLLLKLATHLLGWYGVGFGLIYNYLTLAIGVPLVIAGTILYLRFELKIDRAFWRTHAAWALLNIAIVFACLPPNQRYYLMVMPLLLISVFRGFQSMRKPILAWSFTLLFACLLASISTSLAYQSHRYPAPPVLLVKYLQSHVPPNEHHSTLLVLAETERFAEWYAPDFPVVIHIRKLTDIPHAKLGSATKLYTDNAALEIPSQWKLKPVVTFERSLLITPKHRHITLYEIERPLTSP